MDFGNLFGAGELRAVLEVRTHRMVQEIETLDPNRLQSASTEELTQYFFQKHRFEPVKVRRADAVLDNPPEEVTMDARHVPNPAYGRPDVRLPGVKYVLLVPFDGEPELLRYQPSTYEPGGTPSGFVQAGQLVLSAIHRTTDPPEAVKGGFDRQLEDVIRHAEWANNDATAWLGPLRQMAWERIEARKQRLGATQDVASRMGFRLRERADVPKTFAAPEVRRKIQPVVATTLPGSSVPYKAEPTVPDIEYDHIISLIRSMATVMELSPAAFASMDEESLRFLLLVPLNSHYEGQATGETFNFEGKTDILIRAKGRTIFIAECKVWHGRKALLKTIDQLLGYTSWRDTKTAIVIFNRKKDFSGVLNQIRPTMESHPKFRRFVRQVAGSEFRFIFGQRDDATREFAVTVLVFNVPTFVQHATVRGTTEA